MRYYPVLLISLLILSVNVKAQILSSGDEYSQRGIARFQQNDFDGAIADFTKVIEMNGKNQEFCYYFRGLAYYRKGNPSQAIDDQYVPLSGEFMQLAIRSMAWFAAP